MGLSKFVCNLDVISGGVLKLPLFHGYVDVPRRVGGGKGGTRLGREELGRGTRRVHQKMDPSPERC
jgi:hypothetical protein